jgi:hypothetical protein
MGILIGKTQRSNTLESLECVTALSFFPVTWYFAQAKAHKSAVLIITATVPKQNFLKNALRTSHYKRCAHSKTVLRTASKINWPGPNCTPLFIFPNGFPPIFDATTLHVIGS